MSKKYLAPTLFVSMCIILAGLITVLFNAKDVQTTQPVVETPVVSGTTPVTPTPKPAATTPVKSVVTPVATPATPVATTFTMTQVAAHNSRTDCWTTVNGSVYNVTSWISRHPGGAGAIAGMCGKDASEDFNDQHGGERRPESDLAGFKIGTLIR